MKTKEELYQDIVEADSFEWECRDELVEAEAAHTRAKETTDRLKQKYKDLYEEDF